MSSHQLSPIFAPGLGDGPAYAVTGDRQNRVSFEYPPPRNSQFVGSEWGGLKVLWVVRRTYLGPVLIRGQQVDGPNGVRFEGDLMPPTYLLLNASGISDPGFREWPSFTRLRASGCYAWQVDGTSFSEVIVFQARATRPAR